MDVYPITASNPTSMDGVNSQLEESTISIAAATPTSVDNLIGRSNQRDQRMISLQFCVESIADSLDKEHTEKTTTNK